MPTLLPVAPVLLALQIAPAFEGNPDAAVLLEPWLEGARRSTEAFGTWPAGTWSVHLHQEDSGFEQATGAPPGRFAGWAGATLHLRPWEKLQRRDLGALLRHEMAHRRLSVQALPRWREEALCLWAEGHTHPPQAWPPDPEAATQVRLDRALLAGTTASQRWVYAWLRAWSGRRPLPDPPASSGSRPDIWRPESEGIPDLAVAWPPERLPRTLSINGREYAWRPAARFRFEGEVRFGAGLPVSRLEGPVRLEAAAGGWRLTWSAAPDTWIAAATEGELGSDAPFEAKRALAAVLRSWLQRHPRGSHPDGSFCPLTHCAVVRGQPTREGLRAAALAPRLDLEPGRAFFTGSKGGVSWSPREAWGGGSPLAGSALVVPEDPWATWSRVLSPAQVRHLKASVRPGLRPGQRGIHLGRSGPYSVEALRLAAGRRFGWTAWPSNACEAEPGPDGGILLRGRGWGHNVGLCLATALHRARRGDRAEEILREAFLREAFGPTKLHFPEEGTDP